MMQVEVSEQLSQWVEQKRTVCFDLPVEVDWQTGESSSRSTEHVLQKLVEPLFEVAGLARIVGGKFGANSFRGQGEVALQLSGGTPSEMAIRHSPGVTERLSELFSNPTQGRGVFEELRGTLFFTVDPGNKKATDAFRELSSPHIVKNFGALFGSTAKRAIRAELELHPTRVVAAFSDRSSLRSIHFFGSSEMLRRLIRICSRKSDKSDG